MPALLSVLCLTVPGPVWQWEGRERMFPECLRVPSTVQGAHVLSHLMLTLPRLGPGVVKGLAPRGQRLREKGS